MSDQLLIPHTTDRQQIYETIIPQIEALISVETDLTANLANITAALKEALNFYWIGFYLVKDNQLVLGPFQGTLACTRISFGRGVCGKSWEQRESIIVADVNQFPGHIACSTKSRSEIVVPIIKHNQVVGVIDIDSTITNDFSITDALMLQELCNIISQKLF